MWMDILTTATTPPALFRGGSRAGAKNTTYSPSPTHPPPDAPHGLRAMELMAWDSANNELDTKAVQCGQCSAASAITCESSDCNPRTHLLR